MGWEWEARGDIKYLTIPEWSKWGIKAAFSTIIGGVSGSPFSSLNLGLHVGDNPNDVLQNRKIFLQSLGHSLDGCVVAEQVHGIKVHHATMMDKGRGMQELESAIPGCDGMVTSDDIGLMCFYADCVPIFLICPEIDMIALAHAGWKGTANQILKEVLMKIKMAGGTPEGCFAAIGPCIGSCCYEVDDYVFSAFRENFNKVKDIFTSTAPGKYKLDLVKANWELLISEGILPEHILSSELCTACNPSLFYSYRRDGLTGRMAAFIIKEKR